jgi:hypothetical protein
MEQPGGRTPESPVPPARQVSGWVIGVGATVIVADALADVFIPVLHRINMDIINVGSSSNVDTSSYVTHIVTGAIVSFGILVGIVSWLRRNARAQFDEAQARQRVRRAEEDVAGALRNSAATTTVTISGIHGSAVSLSPQNYEHVPADQTPSVGEEVPVAEEVSVDEQVSVKRRDDGLTLAALWELTHGRLDLYHQIVTRQARNSFGAAQVAMAIGFVLLVVFAVLAAEAKTTTAAIGAGGLGAVGAAFAAYIGKTFIRSQESAASHLRAYFDQPLELSRYLAAERLLADAKDLTPEQRAAIVSSLVQSIATAGQQDGKANEAKLAGRQPRGRASR